MMREKDIKKEFNLAIRHERDWIIYNTVKFLAIEISKESILDLQKERELAQSMNDQNLKDIRNSIIEKLITDEIYDTVFEETINAIDTETNLVKDSIIEETVFKSIEGVVIESVIPQELHAKILSKITHEMVLEIASSTFVELKKKSSTEIQNFINNQINGNFLL